MPNHKKQPPSHRGDVIRCPKCGEDYAKAYRSCPFCAERAATKSKGGRRVANNRRGGGYGAPMNPIHIVMLLLSLVLIVTAAFIVVTTLFPSLFDRQSPSDSAASSQQDSVVVSSLTLDKTQITLASGQTYQLVATVEPEDCSEPIQWSSSDDDCAVVDDKGLVTNRNTSSNVEHAVITALCGDQAVTCSVTCDPAESTDVPDPTDTPDTPDAQDTPDTPDAQDTQDDPDAATTEQTTSQSFKSGSTVVVTGAGGGMKIRSGPGTEYEALDSTSNGVQMTALGDAGNGWVKVQYTASGSVQKTGYVRGEYLMAK